MPIIYRFDVLAALKEAGYSTYRLRKENLLSERAIQQIRTGQIISWKNVGVVCDLLGCDVGDVLQYQTED